MKTFEVKVTYVFKDIRSRAIKPCLRYVMKDAHINPIHVVLELVNRMSQKFGVALFKVGLMYSDTTQLGGAHGGEVRRVRKQNHPSAKEKKN